MVFDLWPLIFGLWSLEMCCAVGLLSVARGALSGVVNDEKERAVNVDLWIWILNSKQSKYTVNHSQTRVDETPKREELQLQLQQLQQEKGGEGEKEEKEEKGEEKRGIDDVAQVRNLFIR